MRKLILLALFATTPALADNPRLNALVKRGDAEERAGHTRAALQLFREAETLDPKNAGVILRISQQYSDLIDTTKPEEAAGRVARKAFDYAERAVELDPKVAKAHLNLAIAYGKLTDFVGNKEKLEYSKYIKSEALKSIELDATDDFAWHVLGRWHSGVANVNGVLKVMAGIVYGGLPPASNEEAIKCLKKATELAPQRVTHRAELARAYQVMGKKDLANKEWKAVLTMKPTDEEDEEDQAAAREALDLPKATPSPAASQAPASGATTSR